MLNYTLARVFQILVTLFVVLLIVFFMVRLTGDPLTVMAPEGASTAEIEVLRRAWGLDRPIWEQYLTFVTRAVQGDFGRSMVEGRPAWSLVTARVWNTVTLALISGVVGLAIAVPFGVLSAVKRNSATDLVSTVIASFFAAMPNFWLGLMLILVFSVHLRILPSYGALEPSAYIMPAIALGSSMAARLSRLTRSTMIEILAQDYIRTAVSKGLTPRRVLTVHALKNALIPILTAFGLQLGWLFSGSVVVETVFSWPGLGRLLVDAVRLRDVAVIQASVLFFTVATMVINLIVDLLYGFLDPRVRYD